MQDVNLVRKVSFAVNNKVVSVCLLTLFSNFPCIQNIKESFFCASHHTQVLIKYSRASTYKGHSENKGGARSFPTGLTFPTRGLKYGFQGVINVKNLRQNSLLSSKGGACIFQRGRGATALNLPRAPSLSEDAYF